MTLYGLTRVRLQKSSSVWPLVLTLLSAAGCGSQAAAPADALRTDAVYNKQTGRLEQLTADQDHDGKNDTVAYMDGTRLKRIEIDRDGDGATDRWEIYGPGVVATADGQMNPF